jgi:hypothetical protein
MMTRAQVLVVVGALVVTVALFLVAHLIRRANDDPDDRE